MGPPSEDATSEEPVEDAIEAEEAEALGIPMVDYDLTKLRWLNSREAAAYLRLTTRALEKKIAERSVPFTRQSDSKRGRLLFDRLLLDQQLEERSVPVGGVTPR